MAVTPSLSRILCLNKLKKRTFQSQMVLFHKYQLLARSYHHSFSSTDTANHPAVCKLLSIRPREFKIMAGPIRNVSFKLFPMTTMMCQRHVSSYLNKKSHYEILGVSRSASKKDIRQAFLRLSKECHPDVSKNGDTCLDKHKKFVQINEAYSVLIKTLSRKDYDMTLNAERYVARHMNAAAYRSHSYGHHPHPGHSYHKTFYEEAYWHDNTKANDSGGKFQPYANLFMTTFCITALVVVLILYSMPYLLPDPNIDKLRGNLSRYEIEKHDLIMTSQHEGSTVYYYAIPKEDDPKAYEVLAVKRNEINNSNEQEIVELTNVYRNRQK
ncbi:unnamed protein product [Lymnaea stagnalis]|uniref:J domain-containing protein n=1 Tax=Lymnaea stagnalis TaxID=6523 RepID=A0AAV2IHC4_LYMST